MLGNNPVMNFFIDVPLKVVKLAVLFSTYGIIYLGQLKRPEMTYLIFGRIKFTKFTDFTGGMEMTGMIHWVSFFPLDENLRFLPKCLSNHTASFSHFSH